MKILTLFLATITFMSSALAGGISGGGGGTVISDPAGTDYITWQLQNARANLLFALKDMSHNAFIEFESLFSRPKNIIWQVENNSINILTDKSCTDFDGKDVDGSINSLPNTICISAFTVGQKVTRETSYPQILALMAHEYSHLVGFDEMQAETFQRSVLDLLKSLGENEGRQIGVEFFASAGHAANVLDIAQRQHEAGKYYKAYQMIQIVSDINLLPYHYPVSALDNEEYKLVTEMSLRIQNLWFYSCLAYDMDADSKLYCGQSYQAIFKGKKEITAEDFSKGYYGYSTYPNENLIPNLTLDPAQYMNEIKKLQIDLNNMADIVGKQLQLQN